VGLRVGVGAGGRVDHVGGVQVGGGGGHGGERLGEVAEGQVLAAPLDEREQRDVPEAGRAPVAQDHLVAVGEGEQLLHPGAEAADHRSHGRLAVAGAEVGGGGGQ